MSENNTEHVHDENCNHEPVKTKEETKITECTNAAIAALTPLLDDEVTQPIGMTLLKGLDIGLSALQKQQQLTDMNSQNLTADTGQPAGGLATVPQNVQVDVANNEQVKELVDQTLAELEGMDDHESPTYTTEAGEQAEYVKGMICNCQYASDFHKYCDNQCKEHLIKATGNTKEYMEYLDTAQDDVSKKTLDDAIVDVDAFVNDGIGESAKPQANMHGQDGDNPLDVHKGGPYPTHPPAVHDACERDTPGRGKVDVKIAGENNRPSDDPIEELTGEKNERKEKIVVDQVGDRLKDLEPIDEKVTDEYGNTLSTEGKQGYCDGTVQPANQHALDPSLPVIMPGEDGTQR